MSSAASPASVVTLGQDTSVVNAEVYTPRGTLPDAATPAWEYVQQDKVTLAMMGNFNSHSVAGRFQGLGATLMSQLTSGGTNISQSVIRPSAAGKMNATQLTAAQDKLHTKADNSVTLTIKTASGKTIQLSLSSNEDGLAVQAQVSGGELSDDERTALAGMADAFQSAIDGFSATPPKLNLDKLAQFNSTVFSSVDLSGKLKLGENRSQTLSFHADAQQRSVQMSGPAGDVKLAVNVKNGNTLGSADQQAKALASYLKQFESAKQRGSGDPALMSLFEDAFSALQSNKSLSQAAAAPTTANSVALSDEDHGMLTGLADFSGSVTQATKAINPMRPSELDTFAYQVSQSTQTKGSTLDRSIDQNQQSQLTASYHKSSIPGSPLDLRNTAASQNYDFYQVDDSASSSAHLGYDKGNLVSATLTQSASQHTTVSKYLLGHLQSTTVTPQQATKTRNLLGLLQKAMQDDDKAKAYGGISTLKDTLSGLQDSVMLQTNPAKLS
ncbi:lactate dehydrogenase [Pseudomonas sp. NA-150]|uniref:lactate dehydrogenase n=1 Tax=Pseudomonas sp. NA-150 TaxID=3367525 RepID=UPI0037CAAF15